MSKQEPLLTPEEIAALSEETQKLVKGFQLQMDKLQRLETRINKLRSKGLFSGNPGDPINIGQI